jgi:hypothetical protein
LPEVEGGAAAGFAAVGGIGQEEAEPERPDCFPEMEGWTRDQVRGDRRGDAQKIQIGYFLLDSVTLLRYIDGRL